MWPESTGRLGGEGHEGAERGRHGREKGGRLPQRNPGGVPGCIRGAQGDPLPSCLLDF